MFLAREGIGGATPFFGKLEEFISYSYNRISFSGSRYVMNKQMPKARWRPIDLKIDSTNSHSYNFKLGFKIISNTEDQRS